MASEQKQNTKYLKVDNWSVFFLQRLQLLFAKGDCCDLTLKFSEGGELKVHRLVLNTCTSYFETLQCSDDVILMPENLQYHAFQRIINFMYSGRLEFKSELHPALLSAAKILNMPILTKLLNAQPGVKQTFILSKQKSDDNGAGNQKVAEVVKKSPPSQSSTPSSSTPVPKVITPPSTTAFNNLMAGKKLPIWRKRITPLFRTPETRPVEEEDPRPTRFEWPGDDPNSMLMTSPSFTSISYESMPVLPSPVVSTPVSNNKPLKRRVVPPSYSLPDKIRKPEENSGENCHSQVNLSDDDDDDGHFETIHNYDDSDDEMVIEPTVNQLKPILKPATESHNSTPIKKVRFSLENEDKENTESKATKVEENTNNSITVTSEMTKSENVPNHAKIIAEVLKKFPELVKNNKNIKLKITAPSCSTKPTTVTLDSNKGKVATKASYVILKSALKSDKDLAQQFIGEKKQEVSNAENTKGPWICKPCGTDEAPLNFESYYLYRRHLQDVHLERIDSRICEHCGYKASKRNLHLYHLYTKHNIAPPKNIKFPKCNLCNYIALSESLLVKHQYNHQVSRELTCHVCNTVFKTSSSLQAHHVTCKPSNESRNYVCKSCGRCFRTNVSLNAHSKFCQEKNKVPVAETGGSETMEMIEVPVIETVDMEKGQHTLLQLPPGIILAETPNMALLPSSESDGLNNVASGIATSIGLTVALPEDQAVILLDENSEFFLQGNNSVMVSNSNVQEYIVPEMLTDVGHIYTSDTSLPYTVSTSNVIAYPVVHVQNGKDVKAQESVTQSDKINTEKENPKQLFIEKSDPSNSENVSRNDFQSSNIEPSSSASTQFSSDSSPLEIVFQEKQIENQGQDNNKSTQYSVTNTQNESNTKKRKEPGPVNSDTQNNVKAKNIATDWDFEDDDEEEDVVDDPDLKPSRPTIDLQEIT